MLSPSISVVNANVSELRIVNCVLSNAFIRLDSVRLGKTLHWDRSALLVQNTILQDSTTLLVNRSNIFGDHAGGHEHNHEWAVRMRNVTLRNSSAVHFSSVNITTEVTKVPLFELDGACKADNTSVLRLDKTVFRNHRHFTPSLAIGGTSIASPWGGLLCIGAGSSLRSVTGTVHSAEISPHLPRKMALNSPQCWQAFDPVVFNSVPTLSSVASVAELMLGSKCVAYRRVPTLPFVHRRASVGVMTIDGQHGPISVLDAHVGLLSIVGCVLSPSISVSDRLQRGPPHRSSAARAPYR